MIILFKSNTKDLVITKQSRILQGENAVDKFVFYLPTTYEEVDLKDAIISFYYSITPVNEANMEILEPVESDKDDFLKYQLSVETKVTKFAGELSGYIVGTKTDPELGAYEVLHSRSVTFPIYSVEDYFKFIPPDSLSPIDAKLLELQNDIQRLEHISEEINLDMPNDLELTDDLLQLKNEKGVIGDGVTITVMPEDPDPEHDGEVDIDETNEPVVELDLDNITVG